MAAYLTVRHDALAILVYELEGVFDRDDVFTVTPIDEVNERRQRCGLAAASGASHEYEARVQVRQLGHRARQSQRFCRDDVLGDATEHGPNAFLLLEVIASKATDTRQGVSKIEVVFTLEVLPLPLGDYFFEKGSQFCVGKRAPRFEGNDVPGVAKGRDLARGKMQVGPLAIAECGKKLFDTGHRRFSVRSVEAFFLHGYRARVGLVHCAGRDELKEGFV